MPALKINALDHSTTATGTSTNRSQISNNRPSFKASKRSNDLSSSPTTTTTGTGTAKSSLTTSNTKYHHENGSTSDSPKSRGSGTSNFREDDYLTPLAKNSRQILSLSSNTAAVRTPESKPSGEEDAVKATLTPESSSSNAEKYNSSSSYIQRSLFPSSITSDAWVGGSGASRPSFTIDTSSFWTVNDNNDVKKSGGDSTTGKISSDTVKKVVHRDNTSLNRPYGDREKPREGVATRSVGVSSGLESTDEWSFMGLPKTFPNFFNYKNESVGEAAAKSVTNPVIRAQHESIPQDRTPQFASSKITLRASSSSSSDHNQVLRQEKSPASAQLTSHNAPSSTTWSALSNTDRLSSRSSNHDKVHPTAVSSYGTSYLTRSRQKKVVPNLSRGIASYGISNSATSQIDFNAENASVVSSTFEISSSVSNLYNRKRMATTANGFPYLPSLHLTRNNSREGNSTFGNTGATYSSSRGVMKNGGISGGISAGIIGASGDGKFQNSYLLRSQGRSTYVSRTMNSMEKEKKFLSVDKNKANQQESSPRIPKYPSNFMASFDKRKKSKRILQWRNQQLKQTNQSTLSSSGQTSTQHQRSQLSTLSPNIQRNQAQSEDDYDDDSVSSSSSYESQDTDTVSALVPSPAVFDKARNRNTTGVAQPLPSSRKVQEKHPREVSYSNNQKRECDDERKRIFPVTSPRRPTGRMNRTSSTEPLISNFPISPLTSAAAAVAESAMLGCSSPLSNEDTQRDVISPPRQPNSKKGLSPKLNENRSSQNTATKQKQQGRFMMTASADGTELDLETTLQLICTPTTTNFNPTCFNEVITSIGSNNSITPPHTPKADPETDMYSLAPNTASYWSPPVRSPSSTSSFQAGEYDSSHCSLNPHDSRLQSRFKPKLHSSCAFPYSLIEVWENCLYVRAEGARTGRLCLTNTHLIFFYEDDVSDVVLSEYGLDRGDLDHALREAFSRGPTPVNVPPDDAGEGGGVEVVGTDLVSDDMHQKDERKDLMDLLESRLEDVTSLEELEKENLTDTQSTENRSASDTIETTSLVNDEIEQPLKGTKTESIANGEDVLQMKLNCQRKIDGASPVPMSESSSNSVSSEKNQNAEADHDVTTWNRESMEESYEEVMNKCIIRAIHEEARRRLQELDEEDESAAVVSTAASCSVWSKDQLSSIEQKDRSRMLIEASNSVNQKSFDHECNIDDIQQVMSSFSDMDLEVDPDEERRRFISGEGMDYRRNTIGIKWPLSKLTEVFNRRYMMREVALELFAASPSPTSTNTIRQTSSTASASTTDNTTIEEIDVPLGPLSKSSVFLVIPDVDQSNGAYNDVGTFGQLNRKKRPRSKRREDFVETLKDTIPHLNMAHWDVSHEPTFQRKHSESETNQRVWTAPPIFKQIGHAADSLGLLTRAWRRGNISNFDYLLRLNAIAGRSFHDPGNYPIMPWVLSNYVSATIPDLSDKNNYRDLSKPMGALDEERLLKFQEKYASWPEIETSIPPFMYGSHYSNTGGVILHYLVRLRPFAGLHRQLQGGQFDVPDRLFKSIGQTWDICSRTSATEVKELTPEWYSDPAFLKNQHGFNLGTSVDGSSVRDVELPPWANNDAEKFIEVMRNALESDVCSSMLPAWIDLIFGFKQRGIEAEKANNVFYHLTYYEPDDIAEIEEESLRTEIQLHIAEFGHCPTQLFSKPHLHKKHDSILSHSKGELRSMAGSNKETTLTNSSPRRILRVQAS